MAASLAPTTKLESINTMLATIGQAPVNSLDAGSADVAIAKNTLDSVSREVQTAGWHFNTEKDYRLLPDADSGKLKLPSTCLRVDTVGESAYIDVVQRGQYLYDRRNHTLSFSTSITVDLVVLLDFEDLPEAARRYITIRAARIFQESRIGSDTLSAFTRNDEAQALALMKKAEGKTAKHNMLTDSVSVRRALDRGARR